ncbi:unnamed protein product [Nippostrongylus brasiliensis]|uniref:DB domain-containing protein n=1 Tax=Nippostrongylus brasiliensis TaxID=27835 RepID=A0A0N4XXA7_NIPBR|nr:unnamed protein product [Nippostrongylus brasiliensis]
MHLLGSVALSLLCSFSGVVDACFSLGCIGGLGCPTPFPFGIAMPQEPNEHFSTCCSLLDVPLTCRQMCTFEGYNVTAIQSSLSFGMPCSAAALAQIQFCAARGVDHSNCCQAAGVSTQCLMFCDQSPNASNELSLSHMQCLEGFESMKSCFVGHALTEYYRGKQAMLDNAHRNRLL